MRRLFVSASLIGALALLTLIFLYPTRPGTTSSGSTPLHPAQTSLDDDDIRVGSVIVADRELRDPNFYQTTILIAKYDEEGTLGLIINRRTDVPISRALDKWKEAKGRSEPVYVGGPVEKGAVMALVRSQPAFEHGVKIGRELQLIADRTDLLKVLSGPADVRFHVYFGYAGWGPDQLEGEIDEGAWHVFPHDASLIFDSEPDTLWPRLIKKTETQIARFAR